VQLRHPELGRRAALVNEPALAILERYRSVYELAIDAISHRQSIQELLDSQKSSQVISYDQVYDGNSEWKLLPPCDHPGEPARCLISGTGLTHSASAEKRRKMHALVDLENDSMRMYQLGKEGGRPPNGQAGNAPEWFYKGNGSSLRAHGEPLQIPSFANDGGEEPEIAGVYVIDDSGQPWRIGMTAGNEFSDHVLESINYLYLAHSKLRQCSLGPELLVNCQFKSVPGEVLIQRDGEILWRKEISSGEDNMCHPLANIEHHHFKYPEHRRPGDLHVHFYGADAFSFGQGVELQDGDVVQIQFNRFGRPLRNSVQDSRNQPSPIMFTEVLK
jgi:hypothetical protein